MAVIAGLFVLETMSVILQMTYFKLTRRLTGTGRRIFRISPIHHHFEHAGWEEVTVVIRFWIIAGICVAAGSGSSMPPGSPDPARPRGSQSLPLATGTAGRLRMGVHRLVA